MTTTLRLVILALVVGSVVYLQSRKTTRVAPPTSATTPSVAESVAPTPATAGNRNAVVAAKARRFTRANEISTPDGFINADKITLGEFAGKKVVLVDFWTYSCINCQRTIPYLNAWYEKYKDKGLVIIGVHTPEFKFEEKYDNVLAAVKKFGIKYPVVLDNDYSTWTAYRNRYWPRKYLVDIDGFVVFDHIGEGGYEQTEKKIQEALAERMTVLGGRDGFATDTVQPEAVVSEAQSPEVYFGASRNTLLGNGKRLTEGAQTFVVPKRIETNRLYLGGTWSIAEEYASNTGTDARIIFRFRAKNVYMVTSAEQETMAVLLLDGKRLGTRAGKDVKDIVDGSIIRFVGDGLSHLVSDPDGVGEHTLEILLPSPGLRVYTFTFG